MTAPRVGLSLGIRMSLLAVLASLAACGPADVVLSYTFVLAAPSSLVLPTRQELDLPLDALAYAGASGRITGNPAQDTLDITIAGLPPLGVAGDKARYQVMVSKDHHDITPRSTASLPRRILRQLQPIGEAWAHDEESLVELHVFDTDAFGRAHLVGDGSMVRLEAVAGAAIDLVVPLDTVHQKRFKVLEGTVGNLPDTGATQATAPVGHHH